MSKMKLLSKLQVLKTQTLQSPCAFQSEKVEECDSGMASDEENPEMQLHALQEAMQRFNIEQMKKTGGKQLTWQPTCWVPQTSFSTPSHSHGPVQNLITLASDFSNSYPRAADLRQSLDSTASSDQESLLEGSDWEQSSLDLELDSSLDFEQKCLGVTDRSTTPTNLAPRSNNNKPSPECLGTSDEEVSELLENLPHVPIGHTVRRRHSSGAVSKHRVNHDSTSTSTVLRRKRHFSDSSRESTVMHRPCLDFEKMQKNVLRKPVPHGVNKVRIVKVKTYNGSCVIKPTPVRCDPSLFTFQPIVRSSSPSSPQIRQMPVQDGRNLGL